MKDFNRGGKHVATSCQLVECLEADKLAACPTTLPKACRFALVSIAGPDLYSPLLV